jgi:Sec63 Brl domain
LLIQAYLEKARLPITDYVNDTKTVMDSVPRILSAMQFVACNETHVKGMFDVVCQVVRARQVIESKSTVRVTSLVARIRALISHFVVDRSCK